MCLPFKRNNLFSSISIDLSFIRLELLILNEIPSTIIISFLTNLSVLPRLYSLTVGMEWAYELDEVNQLILALSKLKYFKCSSGTSDEPVSLPIANDKQLNSIEKLVIDHCCTLNELCNIISYTPELKLMNLSNNYSFNNIILPVSFPTLIHLLIEMCTITFDELEKFIIETECNLKILHVFSWSDYNDYLDDHRWEELIINYLPELEDFYVQYPQDIDPESGSLENLKPPDSFNSLFWNERELILEIEMGFSDILYSICSYKNILTKINNDRHQNLRLLCFHVPKGDDELIQKLEDRINHEKLLDDFLIKRVLDNIYLEWK